MSITVDASAFNRMCRDLGSKMGVETRRAVVFETGKVLGLCVQYTGAPRASNYPRTKSGKPGSTGNVKLEFVNNSGTVWLSAPPGAMAARTGKAGNDYVHYMIKGPDGSPGLSPQHFGKKGKPWKGSGKPMRFPNQIWALANAMIAEANAKGVRSLKDKISVANKQAKKIKGRGLAKQSWSQIATAVGITLDMPAYSISAVTQSGKSVVNGTAEFMEDSASFVIAIKNKYPLLNGEAKKPSSKLDGESILKRAIAARVKAFAIAVQKGVFEDAKGIVSRYGGLLK